MKRIISDKYTIAWFKLSEVISRGEKERALGMYRLLAHSLDNSAFAKQLEGDILFYFNDDAAYDKYSEAIALHVNGGQYAQATMIYEHLLSIGLPLSSKQLIDLISWQVRLKQSDKIKHYADLLVTDIIQKKNWSELEPTITLLNAVASRAEWLIQIKQRIIEAALQAQLHADSIVPIIITFLTELVSSSHAHALQQLLTYLRTTHTQYYEKACEYIQEEDKELIIGIDK